MAIIVWFGASVVAIDAVCFTLVALLAIVNTIVSTWREMF